MVTSSYIKKLLVQQKCNFYINAHFFIVIRKKNKINNNRKIVLNSSIYVKLIVGLCLVKGELNGI